MASSSEKPKHIGGHDNSALVVGNGYEDYPGLSVLFPYNACAAGGLLVRRALPGRTNRCFRASRRWSLRKVLGVEAIQLVRQPAQSRFSRWTWTLW